MLPSRLLEVGPDCYSTFLSRTLWLGRETLLRRSTPSISPYRSFADGYETLLME